MPDPSDPKSEDRKLKDHRHEDEASEEAERQIETLLSEFSDAMKAGTIPSLEPYLRRCRDQATRRKLCSLMNTLALAQFALRSKRKMLPNDPEAGGSA